MELSSSSLPGYGSGRLPLELLSEIFLFCVDEAIDVEGMNARSTIRVPLLLSTICSRWRTAAIMNPQLWSRLRIDIKGSVSKPRKSLVETWLTRSGACPLTIYVVWEKLTFADTHPTLQTLMEHSRRWKTMFFYLPFSVFRSFSSVRDKLPMLTDLSLGTDEASLSAPSCQIDMNMFEIAPRLRSVECVNFMPGMLRFPWAQLEDIPLLSGDIEDCLDILRRGVMLSNLGFVFTDGGLLQLNDPFLSLNRRVRLVCHNHLTSLTIMTPQGNEDVDLSGLFPRLTLPSLENLKICNLNSPIGDEFTHFLSKLHTLKTLHLRKTSVPDDVLLDGLKHLSSLTNLIIVSSTNHGVNTEPTVTLYLLEALTRNFFSDDAMDGMLLPRLRRLELTVGSTGAREVDTFIDMLQSRLRDDEGLARLESVRLRTSVDLCEEFTIRLEELKAWGLAVEVDSSGC